MSCGLRTQCEVVPTSKYVSPNYIFGYQESDDWLSLQNEGNHCKPNFDQHSIYYPSPMYSHSKGAIIILQVSGYQCPLRCSGHQSSQCLGISLCSMHNKLCKWWYIPLRELLKEPLSCILALLCRIFLPENPTTSSVDGFQGGQMTQLWKTDMKS